MAKERKVSEWFEEINSGLEYRRLYGLEDKWVENEALFYNVHDSMMNAGPNIISSTGDTLMSALCVPQPYVTVKARRIGEMTGARVQESTDNLLIDDLEMSDEVERMTLSAYLWGKGFGKIGYDSEFGFDQDYDVGGPKSPMGMTLTQFSSSGKRIEFGKAKPGMPWFQACMPHDIVVPWGTYNLDYAPWIAHRVVRHVDEIKADVKYKTNGLEPVMSMSDFVESYKATMKPYRIGQDVTGSLLESRNVEFCELWEIHDRQSGKIFVLSVGHEKFLRNEVDLLQLEGGLPFVELDFVPRARNFWVTPDVSYLLNVQAELSDIAAQGTKQRRARVMKFLYHEDAFTEADLDRVLDANVGVGVKVKNTGRPLQESITTFQAPGDPWLAQESEYTRRNAREMVGLSANQFGEYDRSTRRTATEAQMVGQSSDLRMGRRTSRMAKVFTRAFRKINPILWKYWTTPRVTQVLGENGVPTWVQFTGDQIKGDYRYSVGFSQGGSETLQARRQAAMQFYAMLRQDPTVDPVQLAQYLNAAFNDPEFSSIFKQGVISGQAGQGGLQMGQNPAGSYQAGTGGPESASATNRFGSVPSVGA